MIESITFQFNWEVSLIAWVQSLIESMPFLKNFFVACTYFGEPITIILVLSFLYWGIDKKMAKYIALRSMVAGCLNPMIKNIFFRNRPYYVNDNIKCLKVVNEDADVFDVKGQGYSFPSGHSTYAASTYGSIAAYLKTNKSQIIATLIMLLTCISRFALGVHYPTDVIVGALTGIISIVVFDFLQKKYKTKTLLFIFAFIMGLGILYCKTDDYFQTYGLYLGFMCSQLFEEKYVNFDNTNKPSKILIRIIFGILVFLAFYKGIKLIVPSNLSTIANNTYIVFRHFIAVFMSMGVYPMTFKYNIFK